MQNLRHSCDWQKSNLTTAVLLRVKYMLYKPWIVCDWLWMSVSSETLRSTFSSTQGKEPWYSTLVISCVQMMRIWLDYFLLECVYSVNAVTLACFVFERKRHPVVSFHPLALNGFPLKAKLRGELQGRVQEAGNSKALRSSTACGVSGPSKHGALTTQISLLPSRPLPLPRTLPWLQISPCWSLRKLVFPRWGANYPPLCPCL